MKSKIFYFIFLIVLSLSGQETRASLEKKNFDLIKQINALEQELKKNKSSSSTSLLYLKKLDEKLAKQSKLMSNIQKEKRLLDDEIYLKQLEINKLNRELKKLRADFQKFLLYSYKKKSLQNKFLFMISSRSIAEVYRRIHYLKIISQYQNRQAEKIKKRIYAIKLIYKQRQKSLVDKEILLEKEKIFQKNLNAEKLEQKTILSNFETDKDKILDKIKLNQKLQQELKSRIAKAIQEEIRVAKEKAELERKKREAELARLKAIEAERLRVAAEEEKKRLAAELVRKNAEELERKKLEAERLKKENELSLLKKEAEEKRKLAVLAEEESAKRRDIVKADNLAKELEVEKIAKEKELALLREKENSKISEIKRLEALRLAEKNERDAINESKKEEYNNASVGSAELSSIDFSKLKGNLFSPISGGVLVGKYGKNPHPLLKGIMVNNNGIDIAASNDKKAKAVFGGKVSAIYVVPGGNKAVLVQHGSYFTLYHNLKDIYVSKGDTINANQNLGLVYTDSDGNTILNFQVWRETSTEDPELWLKRFY